MFKIRINMKHKGKMNDENKARLLTIYRKMILQFTSLLFSMEVENMKTF